MGALQVARNGIVQMIVYHCLISIHTGKLQMVYFSIGSMDMKLMIAFQVKQSIFRVLVYIVSSQNVSLFVQPVLATKGKRMALF